jgi:hypothetical protein
MKCPKSLNPESFDLAVYFALRLARRLNAAPLACEIEAAWLRDGLMLGRLGTPDAFPLLQIARYVQSHFRPVVRATKSPRR